MHVERIVQHVEWVKKNKRESANRRKTRRNRGTELSFDLAAAPMSFPSTQAAAKAERRESETALKLSCSLLVPAVSPEKKKEENWKLETQTQAEIYFLTLSSFLPMQ